MDKIHQKKGNIIVVMEQKMHLEEKLLTNTWKHAFIQELKFQEQESSVIDSIKAAFPNLQWKTDKKIQN